MAIKERNDINFTGVCKFTTQPEGVLLKNLVASSTSEMLWDDIRVAMGTTRRGAANKPTFTKVMDNGSSSVGVYLDTFEGGSREDAFFTIQMPHNYALGTDVRPHIHWMPLTTDTGDVLFEFEYTEVDINGTFSDTTIIANTGTISADSKFKHVMTYCDSTPDISVSFSGISGMWLCRLSRNGADAADTFPGDIAIIEFDLHYMIDRQGSRSETSK